MATDPSLPNIQMNLGRRIKGCSSVTIDDLENWLTPDEGAFPEKIRNQYLNRKPKPKNQPSLTIPVPQIASSN